VIDLRRQQRSFGEGFITLLCQPDAILLDVAMPGMDGPSVVRKLKTMGSTANIPIVLLTARALARDKEQLSNLPVSGILFKPFDPLTLADQVRTTLGWVKKPVARSLPAADVRKYAV
jgi:CheY-like chemotaxis protein